MSTLQFRLFSFIALLFFLTVPARLQAQGTAFTYQGRLTDPSGNPVSGPVDLQIKMFPAPIGGSVLGSPLMLPEVTINNGVFTVTIDFGAQESSNLFTGQVLWMEISDVTHEVVFPRQQITPTPYAMLAASALNANTAFELTGNLPAAQLSGAIASSNLPASPVFSGTVMASNFSGNGAMLTALNPANLSAGTAAINILGNAATATTASNVTGNIADSQLSANIAFLNGTNTFTGTNNFAGAVIATNASNVIAGTFTGNLTGSVTGNASTATSAASATTASSATTAMTAMTTSNFSGSLSGDVTGTQSATVVSKVGGVTEANVASGANAANGATSANAASAIVARDPSGNFSAGTITANLAGNATTATTATNVTGNIADSQLSTNIGRLNGTNSFSGTNTFAGVVVATNTSNMFAGTFTGNGAGLTALNASQLTTGTISLAQLPTAVVTNGASGVNLSGTFSGNGSGLTNVPGAVVWQTVASTNITDAANEYYLLTNSALTTLNLSASPNIGDVVTVSGVGTNEWEVVPAAGQIIAGQLSPVGAVWTEQTGLSTNAGWQSVAMSSNGQYLVAVTAASGPTTGGIYNSTNFGATWNLANAPTNVAWLSVASSSDGSHLAVVGTDYTNTSWIYTSANYGAAWTQNPAPGYDLAEIVSSSDGSHLVTAVVNGGIYTSTNYGATWTHTSAPSNSWVGIASSSDGSHLAATISSNVVVGFFPLFTLGGIYVSTNFGATWTPSGAPTATGWGHISTSADGSHLAAIATVTIFDPFTFWNGIWISTNYGATWTNSFPTLPSNPGDIFWYGIVSSSDGTTISAAGNNGILNSTDYGQTWSQLGSTSNLNLQLIASSSDGGELMAAANGSGVYLTSGGTPLPFIGAGAQTIQFQYVGNGVWQPNGTSAYVIIPSSPVAVMTNGFANTATASTVLDPLRYGITIQGLQTFSSVLGGISGGLNLNASMLSSGVIPQSVLPGFQGTFDTVGGGGSNAATGGYATVPGGYSNTASGSYSFAAGYNAQATNEGAFVWSDGTGTLTTSTNDNSVTMRASGGYRFFTGTNATAGAILKSNATAWASLSDRNAKKNIRVVNGEEVLNKLAAIPIARWNYKWEADSDVPNIGPMAQDFKAAFYPGRDNCTISTLEFDGVELAAIQGLNQKLEEKDAEIQDLKRKNDSMESRLEKLEKFMETKAVEASDGANRSKH